MISFDAILDFLHESSNLLTVVITVFILVIFYHCFWKYRGVPPGPWGVPILGFWPFIKLDDIDVQLRELRDKYGEIYSFTATGNLFVSLNSLKLIREAHITKSECFGDRFTEYGLLTHTFAEAVTIANGESWKVQRKFFLQKFKEYGMLAIKENFSGSIYDTLKETVEEIRAKKGELFSLSDLLTVKCSAIIKRILFNDQGITDEELIEMNREYESVIAIQNHKNLLLMGNIARYLIFPFMPSYWKFLRGHGKIEKMLMKVIKRHKENFDDSQILDIIDCWLKEKKEREEKGDPTSRHFTDKALLSSVYQFVTDGALSVSFFIMSFLQKLVELPEEQKRIYEELVDVLGPDQQPTVDDKPKLPYTSAFIYEVLRTCNFFSFFPSLKCTKETTLRGYRIPKDTVTVMNLWSANHDPNVFEEPDKFNPSRFMSAPDKPKPEFPIVFGMGFRIGEIHSIAIFSAEECIGTNGSVISVARRSLFISTKGKRACMGESLTMIETFLFVATIVKNFELKIPGGTTLTSFIEAGRLKVSAIPRK